jgi:hypothetical protein
VLDWTAQWWLCYHTTGRTSGAGTVYPSGAHEFTPDFSGIRVTSPLVLCVCFGHCLVGSSLIYRFWLLSLQRESFLVLALTFVDYIIIYNYGLLSLLNSSSFDRSWYIYVSPDVALAHPPSNELYCQLLHDKHHIDFWQLCFYFLFNYSYRQYCVSPYHCKFYSWRIPGFVTRLTQPGTAEILILVKGNLSIGKVKSSRLSWITVLIFQLYQGMECTLHSSYTILGLVVCTVIF